MPGERHKVERKVDFLPRFREDLAWWIKADRKVALRILQIVEATIADPFAGIAMPEPLKHQFTGCWSRRITLEHRLIYRVTSERVDFLQARYHYE